MKKEKKGGDDKLKEISREQHYSPILKVEECSRYNSRKERKMKRKGNLLISKKEDQIIFNLALYL